MKEEQRPSDRWAIPRLALPKIRTAYWDNYVINIADALRYVVGEILNFGRVVLLSMECI